MRAVHSIILNELHSFLPSNTEMKISSSLMLSLITKAVVFSDPHKAHLAVRRYFWLSCIWGWRILPSGIQWVEARDTAKHPIMPRQPPTAENYLVQNVNRAEIVKCWPTVNYELLESRKSSSLHVVEALDTFAKLSQHVQAHTASQCQS